MRIERLKFIAVVLLGPLALLTLWLRPSLASGPTPGPGNPEVVQAAVLGATSGYTSYLPIVAQNYVSPRWEYMGLEGVNVTQIAIDLQMPGVLYVGTQEQGIYRTSDYGETWANKSQGLPITTPGGLPVITNIAVDPIDPQNIYASSRRAPYFFWSSDSGEQWYPGGTTTLPITGIVVDPFTPTIVYAATISYDRIPARLLRSVDAGLTWREISPEPDWGHYSFVVLRSKPALLCVNHTDLHTSSDGGDSWEHTASLSQDLGRIAVSPLDEQLVYSTERLISQDGGSSWEPLASSSLPEAWLQTLAASTVMTSTLYAVPGSTDGGVEYCEGVYLSHNRGADWLSMNEALTDRCVHSLAIDPDGSYLYAGTSSGIWRLNLQPQNSDAK